MPRLKYATILRILVILGFLCLWVQILLSVSNDNLDKDGVTEKTKFSGLKLDTDLKSLVTEKTEFSDTDLKVTEKTEFSALKLDTDLKGLVTEKTEFSALKLDTDLKEELMNNNETSEQVLAQVPVELHKYLTVHPRNVSGNATDRNGSPKNISDILQLIHKHNDAQIIHNEDIFGPVQNDTLIIAIQVHTRLTYLRHLIVSLAQAKDIDSTLLVFSHDYYDEEVNALVRSIDFTKVMQIFYPFSIQTHPNEFPGVDPNDCPRDAKLDQALKLKCNNALHPDVHGHYREAKYTQTKHHWWWKANRIFNQLQCTTGHSGMVLFLEEDHYVAEDFIHMMSLLRSTADKSCPNCEILCLGTYLKTYLYHVNSDKQRKKQLSLSYIQQVRAAGEERRKKYQDAWNFQVYPHLYGTTQKVEITPWYSSMHNMGFAINRTVWNNIMELEQQFCAYDDYNWDYSLLHLSQNRPNKQKFKVMLCKGPRVFHIGECGFHHKKKNCNPSIVISKVQKLIKNAKRFLYPTRLTATITSGGAKHNKRLVKGNGGWGDNRDQQLCSNMTKVGRQSRKFDYTSEILSLNRINSVIF